MTTMSPRIRIGSAPDSWGVWFPDDPRQVPWRRFLDEVAEAGYEWIELGPYGYLPTDPEVLAEETGRRGLKVSMRHGLHGPAPRPRCLGRDVGARLGHRRTHARDRRRASRRHPRVLARRQDGRGHRGLLAHGGAVARPDHPDRAARPRGPRALRPADRRPPARRHAHRLRGERRPLPRLHGRGPRLPLPRHGPLRVLRRRQRQAHRDVRRAHRLPPPQAGRPGRARRGPRGRGPVRARRGARRDVRTPGRGARVGARHRGRAAPDVDLFAIVEQDMYPCEPDRPLPIARRTRGYLRSCGV